MNNFYNTLGLCSRAKKIVSGDILFKEFSKNKIKLVIICNNIGNNSKKKILNKCEYYKIPYVFVEDQDLFNQSIGQYNRVAIGICDEGFAQKLHTCLKG